MKWTETAKRSQRQDEEYILWDNKLTLTGLSKEIDLEEVVGIAEDNGGCLVNERPLTFLFYECGQRWCSVETDTFIGHIKKLNTHKRQAK